MGFWDPIEQAGRTGRDFATSNPSQQYGMLTGNNRYDAEAGQQYTGPGNEYGRPGSGGWKWNPGAGTKFANENPIDPNTGMFAPGKGGLVPHNVALQMQAQSDQGIWRSKQAMMRSGMNYAKGALGLLQSFRPGGGATLESGIYNQLGMMEFQRAAQTDYLDLLGDYRRKREDDARRAAKKAADKAMYTQIATAVIGAGAMIATGGAAAPAVMAMGAVGSAAAASRAAGAGASAATSPQMQSQATGPIPNAANIQQPAGGGGGMSGPTGSGPVPAAGNAPSELDIGLANRLGQPYEMAQAGGGQRAQMQNVSMGAGLADIGGGGAAVQGGGAGGGMKQVAQPGQAAVGTSALVGSDGDFSPTAYAANGARSYVDMPMQALTATSAANMMDDDPFFSTMTVAVNSRWNQRLMEVDMQFGPRRY
jgi:hypothetical protein